MLTVNCLYSDKYDYEMALVINNGQGFSYVPSEKISSKLCRDRYIVS